MGFKEFGGFRKPMFLCFCVWGWGNESTYSWSDLLFISRHSPPSIQFQAFASYSFAQSLFQFPTHPHLASRVATWLDSITDLRGLVHLDMCILHFNNHTISFRGATRKARLTNKGHLILFAYSAAEGYAKPLHPKDSPVAFLAPLWCPWECPNGCQKWDYPPCPGGTICTMCLMYHSTIS